MLTSKLDTIGLGWVSGAMGLIFWGLVLGFLYLVVRLVRGKHYFLSMLASAPLFALLYLPVSAYIEYRDYMSKYEPAKAIFDKLCAEQSSPIIRRKVEDVEGILLLNVRPSTRENYHKLVRDPMWPGAAFIDERHEESGYAEYFLLDRNWGADAEKFAPGMLPSIGKGNQHGFHSVDVLRSDGKHRVRITAKEVTNQPGQLVLGVQFEAQETNAQFPQYAVAFEDNVDPQLRKHWIAGTTVKVVDMVSGEVIGQRSFWKWDSGFGDTNQRSPWGLAVGCPSAERAPGVQTHRFVDQVLKAKQLR